MPAVDKLLLEEALQDSPQTRSLLSVFEEDAGTLTDYTNQLLQAMQRVYGAQNEMCLATQQLSKQLLAYEKQNFALGKGDEEVISTLHYFSKVVDEPMMGFAHGQINFFKKGAEMFSRSMDSFLSSVADMVHSIQGELEAEADAMRASQQELLSVDESVYTPDFDVATPRSNRGLVQKAGYLNLRTKTGLVTTTWERLYFFTQGGNLMCQPRGAVDCEDRRYCFQITTPNGKSGIILQAESRKENEEWICAINNISRQIYLTDNPEAVAIKLNQTALQAVTPITSFGKKQESSCPSENPENSEMENDKIVPKATVSIPEAEELIAPGTPIQFDIVLPATEFLDQNRGSRRINPFGETEDDTFPEAEDSLLQQMFIVRFLGSMAVKTDATTEVIYEAMRQVLAARAIHNIFRMTESHLMVTSQTLRLIDPQTQVSRASFELPSVTQFAAHQENKRLVGFVVRVPESTGGESLSTYIFESNSEGEKICYAINLGKEIIEVQKDPEALAQLMLSIPLTNDGKYVLLNDQPDDSDGNPSENRGAESEA
uniref:Adaptor protein, phosphotyrosine interacting with PH domain and leucine zipper 2 n=1 Tax=Rousettus aegyptiacus TaxID=9407 RepID=A0A7J8J9M1_ROUAE|nr:adaptor protein, phosphotyrosine interacting with PH domain and leucine zipper 2 [Rousettus aegyptiacus]